MEQEMAKKPNSLVGSFVEVGIITMNTLGTEASRCARQVGSEPACLRSGRPDRRLLHSETSENKQLTNDDSPEQRNLSKYHASLHLHGRDGVAMTHSASEW